MGHSLYTWHVTFNDQPAVHRLAADYAPVLNDLPTLDPVSVRWLHLTMQGIGFTDKVDRDDVDAIADAAETAAPRSPTCGGPDNVPEDADHFRPHVSLAYSNAAGPAEPIIQRLGAQPVTAVEITVHRAALIDLNRDHKVYE